jgi:plastocyanin
MNIHSSATFRRTISVAWIVLFLALSTTAHATIHIIQFGGSFGLHYSPNSLDVSVGDTIQWQGDFSFHPLSSTSVPGGALTFHQASGSTFTYPVLIAGTYLYQCDVHVASGMTGSLNALATDVENNSTSFRPDAFKLKQNFPNPFNPTTRISFDIPFYTHVTLKVYNLLGEEMATIINENMATGRYTKVWNAASMPGGVYFYRLQAGIFTETKKLILLK